MTIAPPPAEQRHGLTEDEYRLVIEAIGREPNAVELGINSQLWAVVGIERRATRSAVLSELEAFGVLTLRRRRGCLPVVIWISTDGTRRQDTAGAG